LVIPWVSGLCKRLFCFVDDDEGYGKEILIGLVINKREMEIFEGVPGDQAWAAYFQELEKITGRPWP